MDEVLTVEEAARYLRTSGQTVRRLIADGTIPAIQNGIIRISRVAIGELLGETSERRYTQEQVDRLLELARKTERARLITMLAEQS